MKILNKHSINVTSAEYVTNETGSVNKVERLLKSLNRTEVSHFGHFLIVRF